MRKAPPRPKTAKASAVQDGGQCACGAVKLEIDVPTRWAWYDHSAASRHAHGAAYATYVGSIAAGSASRGRYADFAGGRLKVRFMDLSQVSLLARVIRSPFCRGLHFPKPSSAPATIDI